MDSPVSSTSRRSSASLAAESVRSGAKSRHSATPPARPMDGVIDLSLKSDPRAPRDNGAPGGRSPPSGGLSHRNHPYPPEHRRSDSPNQGKYKLAPPQSTSSSSSEPRTEIPPISALDLRSSSWSSSDPPRASGTQGQGPGVSLPSLHALSSSSSPSTHSYPHLATPASAPPPRDYPRSPPRRGTPPGGYSSSALKPSYWDMSKSAPPGRYQYDRREHEMHERDREREREMQRDRERERDVRERERDHRRPGGGGGGGGYPEQAGAPYWRKPDIPEHAYRGEHERHRMPPTDISPPLRNVPLNNKGYAHWHPLDGKGPEPAGYGGHGGGGGGGGGGPPGSGGAGGGGYPYPPPGGRYSPVARHADRPVYRPSPAPETDYYGRPIPPRDPNMGDPHRGRPRNYSAGPAMDAEGYDDDNGPGGGQNRRLAHLLSEQKRRESINTGFQNLRNAIPFSIATDSKAVVLRKATAHIQHLEFLLRRAGVPYVPPPDGWDGMGTPGTLGPDGYRGPIKRERDSDDD